MEPIKRIFAQPQAADAFRAAWGTPIPSHAGYEQLAIILEKQAN
jgi:hypothetical protein